MHTSEKRPNSISKKEKTSSRSFEQLWIKWAQKSLQPRLKDEIDWSTILSKRYGFQGFAVTSWTKIGLEISRGSQIVTPEIAAHWAQEAVGQGKAHSAVEKKSYDPYHEARGWFSKVAQGRGFALLSDVEEERTRIHGVERWEERGFMHFLKDAGLKTVFYRKKKYIQLTWVPAETLRQEVAHQKKVLRAQKLEWLSEHTKMVQIRLSDRLKSDLSKAASAMGKSLFDMADFGLRAFLEEKPWRKHIWFFKALESGGSKQTWSWNVPKALYEKIKTEAMKADVPVAQWVRRGLYWATSDDPSLEKYGLTRMPNDSLDLNIQKVAQQQINEVLVEPGFEMVEPKVTVKSWFKKRREAE